ncbi:PH domain-containing protein [Micromonospora sp. HNM0581]|uniref:PH domain-containing protein n=1 Tax=Micromonospora sp. HNM0581 TaxID=2716341 RepID=UPI00146C0FB3|nr:PH domain-containing protein [Micromonospora sp. HNM0581]NLU79522.1 PH domain-containing protein [Micromonospora sp. HNM0581]
MPRTETARFRHNQAILVAAIVATIGALPLASSRPYLLPVLLVPLSVAVWAWRAGTDADMRGLRVRALAGERQISWDQVVELAADPRGRAIAQLDDGRRFVLPAVRGEDLPRLVAAAGRDTTEADQ